MSGKKSLKSRKKDSVELKSKTVSSEKESKSKRKESHKPEKNADISKKKSNVKTHTFDKRKINNFLFGHEELLWQDYASLGFLGFLIVLFLYSYLKFINVI